MLIKLLRKSSRNFKVLLIRSLFGSFIAGLSQGYSMVYIIRLGADPLQLGYLSSAGSFVNSFISILWGWLMDKLSLKRLFLIILLLETLIPLTYFLSTNWIMALIPMIFTYVLMVTALPLETILRVESLGMEERGTGLGLINMVSLASSIASPAIAGFIITKLGGMTVEGIRPIFLLQVVGYVILGFWTYINLEDVKRPRRRSVKLLAGIHEIFELGSEIKIWLLIELLGSFVFGMLMPFTIIYASEVKKADAITLGIGISAMNFLSMILSIPAGRLADIVGRKWAIIAIRPPFYLSIILLILAPSPEILIIALALRGVLWAGFSAWSAMRMELVPPEYRGRWSGIIGALRGVTRIPAPIIAGFLWKNVCPEALFILAISIDLAIRIPLLIIMPETLRRK